MHIYSSADMHISTILFENMKKVKKILVKMMDELRKKQNAQKRLRKRIKSGKNDWPKGQDLSKKLCNCMTN